MCLHKLDKIKKRHRVGYKKVSVYEGDPNTFHSIMFNTTYKMNEWFDAGPVKRMDYETSTVGKESYPAGVHYYHQFPTDDWNNIQRDGRFEIAIIKVKLKGVIVTGQDSGLSAGVCQMICPVKVCNKLEKRTFEKDNLKTLIKLTDTQCYIDIFNNQKSETPTVAQIKAIGERMVTSDENWVKWIVFVDKFERQHPLFKFMTRVHLALHSGKRGLPKYKENYSRMVRQDNNMQAIEKELTNQARDLNIQSISGPVA